MVGIEFDRTSIPKTSKHSLCHNSLCTNPSKTALYFEKHYILASLVKGEVLSPERIRATTGGIVTPTFRSAPTFQKPHYPSPRTKLASPRKRVRFCCSVKPSQLWWGLNLIELLSLKLQSIRSATIRSAPTLPKPHFPSKSTISLPPLSKVRCCRPKKFGRLPEGLLFYRTLSVSQTPPLTIPQ